jgi:hypothetical protein
MNNQLVPRAERQPSVRIDAIPANDRGRPCTEALEPCTLLSAGDATGLVHSVSRIRYNLGGGQVTGVGNLALFAKGFSAQPVDRVALYDTSSGRQSLFEALEPRVQLSGAADLTHSTANLSESRELAGATAVGDKVLFAGGATTSGLTDSAAVDIFDASTGQWSTARLSHPSLGVPAASADGKAVFWTGKVLDVYDARTSRWSTRKPPHDRVPVETAAVAIGDRIIFAGGAVYPNNRTDTFADVLDVRMGRWSTTRLPHPIDAAGATTVGGRAIFASGTIAEIYDSTTGRWSSADLPLYLNRPGAATVGTKAFFTNAVNPDGSTPSNIVTIYDSVTGRWSTIAALSEARYDVRAAAVGSKVIFAGGGNLPESGAVDVYDDRTEEWSVATPFQSARGAVAAASLGARAFFAGGDAKTLDRVVGNSQDAIDIYTDTSPSPSLSGFVAGRARGHATVSIFNTGDAPLPAASTVTVYASPDRTLTAAVPLGQITLTDALAPASSIEVKVKTSLPATLAPGTYHLLAAVDDHSGSAPTPIAAQSETFSVRSHTAHTTAPRFRGLFAQ